MHILATQQLLSGKSGHLPGDNRRVIFKLTNNTDQPLVVYGLISGQNFLPNGYMLQYDEVKEWLI